MTLTTFDFFRSVLINCINILKFKNNDTSKYECIGGDSRGWGHLFKLSQQLCPTFEPIVNLTRLSALSSPKG